MNEFMIPTQSLLRRTTTTAFLFASVLCAFTPVHGEQRSGAKFSLSEDVRIARDQPTAPDGVTEVPFVETALQPKPTTEETQRGLMLFHRAITEPVHPNTHPLHHERLESGLETFATPGQWETLTLGVYPLRKLKNFQLRVSDLKSDNGVIESSQITVRLQTYWKMGYPRYASRETYRRVPELLERVNTHDMPKGECQRWWIQIHVPKNTKPGVYRGMIGVQHDDINHSVLIPVKLRVLGYPLRSDPNKHYSAYYYPQDRRKYQDKDEAFYQKASANEYQMMLDYGIDMYPTFYLTVDSDLTELSLQGGEEIERLQALGMTGPIPILGGNAIGRIYSKTTPGGKRQSHWTITKMPPPEFYEKVEELFRKYVENRKDQGLPPVVCCVLDEVAASHKEFGIKVYQAVHAAGMTTYTTKWPSASDAHGYMPYVDVWCSQPFGVPYEKIIAQDRHQYWSYPNHNAGERKNRHVMCKGGRMTYGFGFWRSGYTTLIPWHWSWTMEPDIFDYLRTRQSGTGMRMSEDGEFIPAMYWDCFRKGRDDARYLYTLQQAVFERDGSSDPKCRRIVDAAKRLLQETWDSIEVHDRYLSTGMWPSEEFDSRRWVMAMLTQRLMKFPVVRQGTAPSVLVDSVLPNTETKVANLIEDAKAKGIVKIRDVGEGFSDWKNDTVEGKIELTTDAAHSASDHAGLRWKVKVAHAEGGNPDHLVGWPRIRRVFKEGDLDLSQYDFLEFMIRVDSDRDEVQDDVTNLGLSIRNYGEPGRLYETVVDLGDQQRTWIPMRFSIKEMIRSTALGNDPWKKLNTLQLFISEADYADGTSMTFDIGSARLLSLAKPLLSDVQAPRYLTLPRKELPIAFDVIGLRSVKSGSHSVNVTLVDAQGKVHAIEKQDLFRFSGNLTGHHRD